MGTVFVTGGTGFIGTAFVRAAVAAGWDVRGLARSERSAARLHELGAWPVEGDVFDASGTWRAVAADADTVAHLAQPQTFGAANRDGAISSSTTHPSRATCSARKRRARSASGSGRARFPLGCANCCSGAS